MVYDPIRDCEVPSPAVSSHGAGRDTPGHSGRSDYFDAVHGSGGGASASTPSAYPDGVFMTPGGGGGGVGGGPGRPPNFTPSSAAFSPSLPQRSMSSSSGGLRGLLNNDDPDSRRGSGNTAASEDDRRGPSPSIHRLLNEPQPAPRSSASSVPSSSPSHHSPGSSYRHLDPSHPALLTPGPSSSGSRTRSPHPGHASAPVASPHGHGQGGYASSAEYAQQSEYLTTPSHASSSQRRSSQSQSSRPMLPPDVIRRPTQGSISGYSADAFEPTTPMQQHPHPHPHPHPHSQPHPQSTPSRHTPSSSQLPLRSPSVSVSPRSHHQSLPPAHPLSRPGSSSSQSYPQSLHPGRPLDTHAAHLYASPSYPVRRLSEGPSRPTSSAGGAPTGSGSGNMSRGASRHSLPRRESQTSVYTGGARSPSPPLMPVQRTPYDPHRVSEANSVLIPILPDEIARLRSLALTNNPLRKQRKQSAPSWSGAPVSASAPSRSSVSQKQGGAEKEYAAGPQDGRSRERGRGSVSASASASVTPMPEEPARRSSGPSAGRGGHDGYAAGGSNGHNYDEPAMLSAGSSSSRKRAGGDDGSSSSRRRRMSGHDGDEGMPGIGVAPMQVQPHFDGNGGAVASHYNSRPEVGVQSREFSPIIGLKKFNNWIKSVLIGKFAQRPQGRPPNGTPGANVLDMGCGKGGDLNKWKQARIRLYVGIDIADMSVDQARERHRTMPRNPFEGHFFAYDCFSQPISEMLPPQLRQPNLYDNVTLQFCMHYAFESASKARMMLENVARYLRPGGTFIGTIPNAEVLLAFLNDVPEDAEVLRFGNSCYFVEFEKRQRDHAGVYGHAYRFYLQDAVDDVPEYVVHWDNFESLAHEYGLRLVYRKPFSEVLNEEQASRDFGPLLGKMGVLNERGESAMDADQWAAANLYMAFAFEKV